MFDAIWTLAKALDELMTMKELKVEGVDCGTGRRNGPGKRSADEVLKKLLEVRYRTKRIKKIYRVQAYNCSFTDTYQNKCYYVFIV